MYAASDRNADALYFGKVEVPDPFISFGKRGKRVAVVNRLEFNRVRTTGRYDEVLPLEEWQEKARAHHKAPPSPADIIRLLAKHHKIKRFRVPFDFPAGLALELQETLDLEVAAQLFPERAFKTEEEAEAIREGNDASAAGFRTAETVLREAEIRKGKLYYGGRPLTSERLREQVDIACLGRGALAVNTIVAGGDQACDPHERGHGHLRANELIIIDIFPRVIGSGYHGDMTRTYLKGQASEAQRALVETVRAAQQMALPLHTAGTPGKDIFERVQAFFREKGYATKTENGVSTGFFHGLGHGLGLEVHEPPRVSIHKGKLAVGHVVTVEPGLYYPGLGGCRIEDVVWITKKGPELLSRHPYRWEFR